jgi:hypothetical protein
MSGWHTFSPSTPCRAPPAISRSSQGNGEVFRELLKPRRPAVTPNRAGTDSKGACNCFASLNADPLPRARFTVAGAEQGRCCLGKRVFVNCSAAPGTARWPGPLVSWISTPTIDRGGEPARSKMSGLVRASVETPDAVGRSTRARTIADINTRSLNLLHKYLISLWL